jgi:hypothetical protein
MSPAWHGGRSDAFATACAEAAGPRRWWASSTAAAAAAPRGARRARPPPPLGSACDLVARRPLLAGDLGVSAAAAHPLKEVPAEAMGDALARRKLGMRLRERPPARGAGVAALAPREVGQAPRQRQVAYPHPRAVLDIERGAPSSFTPSPRSPQDRRGGCGIPASAAPPGSAIHDHAEPCEGSRCLLLGPQPRSFSKIRILTSAWARAGASGGRLKTWRSPHASGPRHVKHVLRLTRPARHGVVSRDMLGS